MIRIMAIDYGKKRVGIALSDPMGMTAQPKDFIDAGKNLFAHLVSFIQEWGVQKILVGHPISLKEPPAHGQRSF